MYLNINDLMENPSQEGCLMQSNPLGPFTSLHPIQEHEERKGNVDCRE